MHLARLGPALTLLVATGVVLLAPRPEPPPPLGLRVVPERDGWAVRWQGEDGQTRTRWTRGGAVEVGGKRLTLPPRDADVCRRVRVSVVGDGRGSLWGPGVGAYRGPVFDAAAARGAELVLDTGDLVKGGRLRSEWSGFLRSVRPWPPSVVVRGNHDRGPHFEALGLAPEVFAHRFGPLLVAGIDVEFEPGREAVVPPRIERLEDLLASSDAPWKMVLLHRPIWSTGPHGSDQLDLNHLLVPVFDRQRVALVVSGHDHDYERMCPSTGLGEARRCDPEGTLYLTSGGAATFTAPLPNPRASAEDRAASRFFSGSRHFVEIDVERGTLTVTAHRTLTGNLRPPGVMDTFTLRRADPCG